MLNAYIKFCVATQGLGSMQEVRVIYLVWGCGEEQKVKP